jgi:hypothetical protein
METWQRQLLMLLGSMGWFLSVVIIIFLASYLTDTTNPLRNESLAGAAIPSVYGLPVWVGLALMLTLKWKAITKRQKYFYIFPLFVAFMGFVWPALVG